MDIILLFLAKLVDKHGTTLVRITYPPLNIQSDFRITRRCIFFGHIIILNSLNIGDRALLSYSTQHDVIEFSNCNYVVFLNIHMYMHHSCNTVLPSVSLVASP